MMISFGLGFKPSRLAKMQMMAKKRKRRMSHLGRNTADDIIECPLLKTTLFLSGRSILGYRLRIFRRELPDLSIQVFKKDRRNRRNNCVYLVGAGTELDNWSSVQISTVFAIDEM